MADDYPYLLLSAILSGNLYHNLEFWLCLSEMRRKRGAITNIVICLVALSGILYFNSLGEVLNRPKLFAWTTIRYKSVFQHTSQGRGVCPGLSGGTDRPVLVVARITSENSSWLNKLSSKYHICKYTADAVFDSASAFLQTPGNRGHESMAYLTFIIDNYDHLPDSGMVFVHGSRFAWHNDDPAYDNLSLLNQLDVQRALWGPPGLPTGYWNLKCDWSAGMCDTSSPDAKPQGSLETRTRALLERNNKRVASDAALVQGLRSIFGGYTSDGKIQEGDTLLPTTLDRSDAVRGQCCAQFVVSKQNIMKHTKDEYIALRQWLLDGSEKKEQEIKPNSANQDHHPRFQKAARRGFVPPLAAPADDLIAGRVLSYLWHILFLPASSEKILQPNHQLNHLTVAPNKTAGVDLTLLNTLACPSAQECYCRLYGRCNLTRCNSRGRCQGQYEIPLGFKLPENWANTHP